MEAAVLRGKCKKKLPVFVLLLLCVLAPTLSAPATSSEGALIGRNHSSHGNLDKCPIGDYISNNGVCCKKCHPGERLVGDCPERNSRTLCEPCKEGTFMAKSNTVRNCRRCRDCRASNFEEELSPCERYKDRECRCVKGYYRNDIDSLTHECLECKNCRSQRCQFLCGPESPLNDLETTKPPENVDVMLPVVVVCCVGLLGVISLVTSLITKKCVKRKMRLRIDGSASFSDPTSRDSQKSTKSLIPDPERSERQNLAVPTQECESDLPDCVPKEIKIQKVIYSVLDLVSVRHVKQLVRSLGVSERDIERAEVDYRLVQEANYQMLKLWAEGGGGGGARAGRGVLPRALLQDLLDNLRGMDLGGVAEELEEKFRVQ